MEDDKVLRVNTVNKPDWKYTRIIVDKDNVNKIFVLLSTRRDLRKAQVRSLTRLLEKGQHWQAPFVANKIDDKYRLIDGNHRKEALEAYFAKNPLRKVDIPVSYYENLTEEQEKEEYKKWNRGAKQSANDFLQMHWDVLKFPQWWEKNAKDICDLHHKPKYNHIALGVLIAPYYSRGDKNMAWLPSGEELVSYIRTLDSKDYKRIKDFVEGYVKTFGAPDQNNKLVPMWQQLQFWSFAAVYWRNMHRVDTTELWTRLAKASRDSQIAHPLTGSSGSRDNVIRMYDIIVSVANRGIKSAQKKFPSFLEEHPPRLEREENVAVVA